MGRTIIYITFIPWFLHYGFSLINSLKLTKSMKFNFKWLKKNYGKIFHIEEILLIAIFIYLSRYGNQTFSNIVHQMLFSVMNLYLFVNSFYDKRTITKNKIGLSDLKEIIILVFITSIPFIYFIRTNNMLYTYYIMFCYGFLNFIFVLISRLISFIIGKIFHLNGK